MSSRKIKTTFIAFLLLLFGRQIFMRQITISLKQRQGLEMVIVVPMQQPFPIIRVVGLGKSLQAIQFTFADK